MRCPACAKADLVRDTRDLGYNYKGESTTIPDVTGDYCPACGVVVLDAGARLDSRRAVFSSWTKAERKRHFADLLESFDPMYPSLYLARLAQGQQVDAPAPEALDAWANKEWVDPRW